MGFAVVSGVGLGDGVAEGAFDPGDGGVAQPVCGDAVQRDPGQFFADACPEVVVTALGDGPQGPGPRNISGRSDGKRCRSDTFGAVRELTTPRRVGAGPVGVQTQHLGAVVFAELTVLGAEARENEADLVDFLTLEQRLAAADSDREATINAARERHRVTVEELKHRQGVCLARMSRRGETTTAISDRTGLTAREVKQLVSHVPDVEAEESSQGVAGKRTDPQMLDRIEGRSTQPNFSPAQTAGANSRNSDQPRV